MNENPNEGTAGDELANRRFAAACRSDHYKPVALYPTEVVVLDQIARRLVSLSHMERNARWTLAGKGLAVSAGITEYPTRLSPAGKMYHQLLQIEGRLAPLAFPDGPGEASQASKGGPKKK